MAPGFLFKHAPVIPVSPRSVVAAYIGCISPFGCLVVDVDIFCTKLYLSTTHVAHSRRCPQSFRETRHVLGAAAAHCMLSLPACCTSLTHAHLSPSTARNNRQGTQTDGCSCASSGRRTKVALSTRMSAPGQYQTTPAIKVVQQERWRQKAGAEWQARERKSPIRRGCSTRGAVEGAHTAVAQVGGERTTLVDQVARAKREGKAHW